jgi:hypothetical protein
MGTSGSKLIRITSEEELEALQVETAINTTTKFTKVSDESAMRALIRGNVRTQKKAMKDIALSVSHLFPDSASGATLDDVADDHGISPRFAAAQSSTYIRLVGTPGTTYIAGTHTFSDNKGNVFDLTSNVTLPVMGYAYGKVRSQQSGLSTNVDPYTIVNINAAPVGHVGLINEYGATGGRDIEDDEIFRKRIKEGPDALARKTLSYLTQAFMKTNSNVLRTIYEGVDANGKVVIGILTVNGIDLTADELATILSEAGPYFALTELAQIGTTSYGVKLKNVDYYPIDVDFRIQLVAGANFDATIKDIQVKFSKYVDFRTWDSFEDKIEWDDLLSIAKTANNGAVKQVPDTFFTPGVDIKLAPQMFPRFRGFIVRDLNGNVLSNTTGTLQPIFYPNEIDPAFVTTVI